MRNVIDTIGTIGRGYRVRDIAGLLRVGRARVLAEIRAGRLPAVDLGQRGHHRYVVLPEMLDQWVNGRLAAPVASAPAKRRPRTLAVKDYFPDD
jgi:hypothetical protein